MYTYHYVQVAEDCRRV